MKKGFTLAEVLITMIVLGIIMAISIPLLMNSKPSKDAMMYKKAIYNIQAAMVNVMNDPMSSLSTEYWADPEVTDSGFCEAFENSLNTLGEANCSGTSTYDKPNLTTSDGIKIWGLEGTNFTATGYKEEKGKTIYVDRELSESEKKALKTTRDASHTNPGLKILVTNDGRVKTKSSSDWDFENDIIKKFISTNQNN